MSWSCTSWIHHYTVYIFWVYQLTLIARSSLISSLPFPAISIIRSHRFSIIPSPGSSLIFSWFSPCTTTSAKSSVGLYCNKQHNSKEQQSKQTALHYDGWEDSRAQDWEKPMSQCAFVGWKISRSGRDPPGQIVLPWQIKYVGVNWSINAISTHTSVNLRPGQHYREVWVEQVCRFGSHSETVYARNLEKLHKLAFVGRKIVGTTKIDRS